MGMSCPGQPADYIITVKPIPEASITTNIPEICSGSTTFISFESNILNTVFTWNTTQTGGVNYSPTSCSTNCSSPIQQVLSLKFNVWNNQIVSYTITPTANGCIGDSIDTTVTVKPNPNVIIYPPSQGICNNDTTDIQLTSNVTSGVTFGWTAKLIQGYATGFSNGTGPIIQQSLNNPGSNNAIVRYTAAGTANSCTGDSNFCDVTIYPTPIITNTSLSSDICSGQGVGIALSMNVSNPTATFIWTALETQPPLNGKGQD